MGRRNASRSSAQRCQATDSKRDDGRLLSQYYIRESRSSKRWIIYLEGGWYCFDEKSCNHRWSRSRNLMSSTLWPETRSVGGILSPDPEENPYWWDANQVFLPYCSSDTWSGASHSSRKENWIVHDTKSHPKGTPVVVDQRAAWRKLYGHSPPCGAGVNRLVLTSPSVVHCQFFELFGAPWSTASKLASLWNCSTEHEFLLRGEFSFLGSLIIIEVIKDLLNKELFSADMLLLAGSSKRKRTRCCMGKSKNISNEAPNKSQHQNFAERGSPATMMFDTGRPKQYEH
ncbi:palmitoleoyl-protein carboxylesterase NOTUM [Trichonephila clavipes]|nr:palmitoleoyl-protein carboxylesterase NOTUM [Trichonephila clavipes]